MVSREDIESFLDRVAVDDADWREVEPGLWVVRPEGPLDVDIVVNHAPPVVLLRVKVMDLPKDEKNLLPLMRQLLEWNAKDLVHGSYGISDGAVVLTESMQLSHLEYEEFLSAYESITLALPNHLRALGAYRDGAGAR